MPKNLFFCITFKSDYITPVLAARHFEMRTL